MIAHESGAADSADPFAGSYLIEALTDEIERRANVLIARVDALGGSLKAIPFITNEIDESAWSYQERYRTEQDVVVGVNRYCEEREPPIEGILHVDPDSERDQRERLAAFKQNRDVELVNARLEELRATARGSANLLTPIGQAMRYRCTLGEVCGALRDVFGSYQPL